jgi:uncharacterized membrane protein
VSEVVTHRRERDASVDLLRGAVMILMALDHARDFFGGSRVDPTDLAHTTVPLFFTRWITHFCAPVFIFLAGTAARLAGRRRSRADLARFLVSRGLWLVFIELTVVRVAWSLDVTFQRFTLQVIWVIGVSMIALAAFVAIPAWIAGVFGAVLVVGHDAFDHVAWNAPVWHLLHEPGMVHTGSWPRVFVLYPLVPWVGVMALGYAFGGWLTLPVDDRRRRILASGAIATIAFVVVRGINRYADPEPWHPQSRAVFTLLSFLDCEKYPPSLDYLLMTLGPSLLVLGALTGRTLRWGGPVITFGRVPFFYYIAHLYLLHGVAALIGYARHAPHARTQWGAADFSLAGVYVAWIVAIVVLYPACRWFADLKARRSDTWLSYL